jgi:hypothetical protein
MMMQLYSDEMIANKNKFLKICNIAIFGVSILIIATLIILFLISTKESMMIYLLLNSFISILFCWSLILYINLVIKPLKIKLRNIESMKKTDPFIIKGLIKGVSKDTITVNKLQFKTIAIEVKLEGKVLVKSIYLDDDIDLSLTKNSIIEVDLRNSTIFSYQLIGDHHE